MVDIIIPTNKQPDQVVSLVEEIKATCALEYKIIATCQQVSAASNRNYGLNLAVSPYIIMIDDDVSKLPNGWDRDLIAPLQTDPNVVMVSARLMGARRGNIVDPRLPGQMVGNDYRLSPPIIEVPKRELPTACIAFRKDKLRFDERFLGSGFEDNHFCFLLRKEYPHGKFVINNNVKVLHSNEMKNQHNNWHHNRQLFNKLTGERR